MVTLHEMIHFSKTINSNGTDQLGINAGVGAIPNAHVEDFVTPDAVISLANVMRAELNAGLGARGGHMAVAIDPSNIRGIRPRFEGDILNYLSSIGLNSIGMIWMNGGNKFWLVY